MKKNLSIIRILLTFVIVVGVVGSSAIESQAAAYFDILESPKTAKVGTTVELRYSGYQKYDNERFFLEIHEGSPEGRVVATADGILASLDSDRHYISGVRWNTTGCAAGDYYAIITSQYWHDGWITYPYTSRTKIILIDYDPITEADAIDGYSAMYRMYNPNTGEHLYSSNLTEANNLLSVGWQYEGVAWYAPVSGDPVYRMYNQNSGEHHYTTNVTEKDVLVSVGWIYEGIGRYSGGNSGLYRLYNPGATTGAHHYTTSETERDSLASVGWIYEGVGWYGR